MVGKYKYMCEIKKTNNHLYTCEIEGLFDVQALCIKNKLYVYCSEDNIDEETYQFMLPLHRKKNDAICTLITVLRGDIRCVLT
jgi:hypothetical protein